MHTALYKTTFQWLNKIIIIIVIIIIIIILGHHSPSQR